MSFLNATSVIGTPVWVNLIAPAFFLLVAAWVLRKKGNHPATFNMNDGWTHEPILWAAVDEQIGSAHGHGHVDAHSTNVIGGTASGKW